MSSVPIYDHLSEYEAAKMLSESSPAFIVGTGRCGTKYYAELIRDFAVDVESSHEPQPRLIRENYNPLVQESLDVQKVVLEAVLAERLLSARLAGKRCLISSQIFTGYLDAIAVIFETPLILHAVRDPYSFISSGVSQGWFLNATIWEESRKLFMEGAWEGRPQVVKLAMYWANVNSLVLSQKDRMQVHTFRIEDVSTNVEAALDLISRVGLLNGTHQDLAARIAEKVNKREDRKLLSKNVFKPQGFRWAAVSEKLRAEVAEIVGPVADALGYPREIVLEQAAAHGN